jgi:dTDP-glucose 4,6-dehydratase
MKILITGGAGFIGSHFVEKALKKGANVHVIDSLSYAANLSFIDNFNSSFFTKADINDNRLVSEAVNNLKPDYIINFAAETHVDRSIVDAEKFLKSNLIGLHSLLKVLPKKTRFIQISTDEVFGSLNNEIKACEVTPFAPQNPYSATKAAADHLLMAWQNTYNIDAVIARSCNVFGPRQNYEKFIPKVIQSISSNRPIPLYGNGMNIRQWIFVEECCEAILKIMENGKSGHSYNIGTENSYSNLELLNRLISILISKKPDLEKQIKVNKVTDRPGHDFRYELDYQKLIQELAWKPENNFDEQLSKTIDHYLQELQV